MFAKACARRNLREPVEITCVLLYVRRRRFVGKHKRLILCLISFSLSCLLDDNSFMNNLLFRIVGGSFHGATHQQLTTRVPMAICFMSSLIWLATSRRCCVRQVEHKESQQMNSPFLCLPCSSVFLKRRMGISQVSFVKELERAAINRNYVCQGCSLHQSQVFAAKAMLSSANPLATSFLDLQNHPKTNKSTLHPILHQRPEGKCDSGKAKINSGGCQNCQIGNSIKLNHFVSVFRQLIAIFRQILDFSPVCVSNTSD